jgi:hypothetical protein
VFRSAWKDFETRSKSILERLRHHPDLIAEQAVLLHYQQYEKDSQELQDHIQQYRQNSQEVLRHVQQYRNYYTSDFRLALFAAASPQLEPEPEFYFCAGPCRSVPLKTIKARRSTNFLGGRHALPGPAVFRSFVHWPL